MDSGKEANQEDIGHWLRSLERDVEIYERIISGSTGMIIDWTIEGSNQYYGLGDRLLKCVNEYETLTAGRKKKVICLVQRLVKINKIINPHNLPYIKDFEKFLEDHGK